MANELIYTSVPRGLNAGANGFCTVAATQGLSLKLEGLSSYEFFFQISDPQAQLNPVNFAHTRVTIDSDTCSVLSRIAFSGADHTHRTNKIAHHFLLEPAERGPEGPAWMLLQMASGTFRADYKEPPQPLPPQDLRRFATAPRTAGPARHWQNRTGDAGWAGVLAKAYRDSPKVPAFVVFSPGMDLLPLFEEALAVLPQEERWAVGFATYYSTLPPGCQYHWRGIVAGSPAEKEIARFPNAAVIDLTKPLPRAAVNEFTEAARAGRSVSPAPLAGTAVAPAADAVLPSAIAMNQAPPAGAASPVTDAGPPPAATPVVANESAGSVARRFGPSAPVRRRRAQPVKRPARMATRVAKGRISASAARDLVQTWAVS
jgi:hypothetical protein